MTRPVRAIIDLAALHHNLGLVRQHAPNSKVMAVIKADGYGHGLLRVANALSDADGFAVADIDEGLALRHAGYRQPVCLLTGFHEISELHDVISHDLTIVLHSPHQIEALEAEKPSKPPKVWVKIDTGMHRIGFEPGELHAVLQRLAALSVFPTVLMSHLANADDSDDPYTRRQLETYLACCRPYPYQCSLANSAGVVAWMGTRFDWVRPGIMLYGLSPLLNLHASALGLLPVMTFESRLIAIKALRVGDPVGYGGDWVCPEPMPVGVVACGYGDGYPRHAASGTPLRIGQRTAPLVGRVSMDLLTVDLRDHPTARVGDRVVGTAPSGITTAAERLPSVATVDEERGLFVEPVPRLPRVIVFGAGHVGNEIARLAARAGFYVVAIDDRPEFADPSRLPGVDEVIVEDLRTALDRLRLDTDDYVLATTRGHRFDAEIVEATAASNARYVGMLGSARKKTVIWKTLESLGVPRAALERVRVPIGERIGADTPAEIAVSVVAELIRIRRLGNPGRE